jgi:hypothetical protein
MNPLERAVIVVLIGLVVGSVIVARWIIKAARAPKLTDEERAEVRKAFQARSSSIVGKQQSSTVVRPQATLQQEVA